MTDHKMPALDPCPYCGSDDVSIEERHMLRRHHATCANCGEEGVARRTERQAAVCWNIYGKNLRGTK